MTGPVLTGRDSNVGSAGNETLNHPSGRLVVEHRGIGGTLVVQRPAVQVRYFGFGFPIRQVGAGDLGVEAADEGGVSGYSAIALLERDQPVVPPHVEENDRATLSSDIAGAIGEGALRDKRFLQERHEGAAHLPLLRLDQR